MKAIELIAAEHNRQIEEECYTPNHDDQHDNGELADAAAVYAANRRWRSTLGMLGGMWPWDAKSWKPTPNDRIRELVK